MRFQIVTPRAGTQWVREGLRAFGRQPMVFFSLFMLFMTAVALLSRFPLVGGVLAVMLAPAMTLALMAATEQTARHSIGPVKAPTATVFLAALQAVRDRARALALLGVLYAAGVLAVGALATLITGDPFAQAFTEDGTPKPEVIQSAGFQMALLLRMALYVPVALAFWHAPALVHWHGVPPVKSLFFSLVTCLRNIGAMALFVFMWVGVLLVASIGLSLAATLLMAVTGAGALGVAAMVGGSFVLSAMFFASTWFSFRDSFEAD